ncbi:hypothetical protein GEMRC1_001605 [Eukaryota sp. GEM-RC1]
MDCELIIDVLVIDFPLIPRSVIVATVNSLLDTEVSTPDALLQHCSASLSVYLDPTVISKPKVFDIRSAQTYDQLLRYFPNLSEFEASQWIASYPDLPLDTLVLLLSHYQKQHSSFTTLSPVDSSSNRFPSTPTRKPTALRLPVGSARGPALPVKKSQQNHPRCPKPSMQVASFSARPAASSKELHHLSDLQSSRSRLLSLSGRNTEITSKISLLSNLIDDIQNSVLPSKEGILDLHYFDTNGAEQALERGISYTKSKSMRQLKVITGRGQQRLFNLVYDYCKQHNVKFQVDRNTWSFQLRF